MIHLGVSNLAWPSSDNQQFYSLLKKHGIQYLEIAPTKIWDNLLTVTKDDCRRQLEQLAVYNLRISSVQSIYYGRDDLNIFTNYEETKKYFIQLLNLFSWLGLEKIVFGSPKTRSTPAQTEKHTSERLAEQFFSEIAENARGHAMTICLEPNSKLYGCNFLTTTSETNGFVEKISHRNLQLNLDLSTILLNKEPIADAVRIAEKNLAHVHISAPYLKDVRKYKAQIKRFVAAIQRTTYSGLIVLEMLSTATHEAQLQALDESITFLQTLLNAKPTS